MKRIRNKRYRGDRIIPWFRCFWGSMAVVVLLAGCGNSQGNEPSSEETLRTVQAADMSSAQGEEGVSGATGTAHSGEEPGAAGTANSGEESGAAGTANSGEEPGAAGTANSGEASDSTSIANSGGQSGAAENPNSEGSTEPEITLVMVGDILLHTPVAESGKGEDGYDFGAVFARMKEEIERADLALVNQEVILGGEELGVSGYPNFNAPYELGDALVDAGFDVVLHATNHALDKGKQGVLNCISFWQEEYPEIAVLGIHGSQEDQQEIYVYEQEGIRVAILNYTYGTNGIPLPTDMPYAVDMLEKQRVISDLQRAEELSDFVIVCPHWGTEYVLDATKEQEDWAKLFAENGADLVLGTHPHVIEPFVWIGEEGSDFGSDMDAAAEEHYDDTLVYYSLGNFVNWTSSSGDGIANRMVGGMAQVTIGRNETGEAVIKSYDVEPLVCHLEQGFGGVTVYPLAEYTEELAGRNEIVKQDSNFSLEYCRKLAEAVFGK